MKVNHLERLSKDCVPSLLDAFPIGKMVLEGFSHQNGGTRGTHSCWTSVPQAFWPAGTETDSYCETLRPRPSHSCWNTFNHWLSGSDSRHSGKGIRLSLHFITQKCCTKSKPFQEEISKEGFLWHTAKIQSGISYIKTERMKRYEKLMRDELWWIRIRGENTTRSFFWLPKKSSLVKDYSARLRPFCCSAWEKCCAPR
jgi:hypothetical protein